MTTSIKLTAEVRKTQHIVDFISVRYLPSEEADFWRQMPISARISVQEFEIYMRQPFFFGPLSTACQYYINVSKNVNVLNIQMTISTT